jgi:hypothetical protein
VRCGMTTYRIEHRTPTPTTQRSRKLRLITSDRAISPGRPVLP